MEAVEAVYLVLRFGPKEAAGLVPAPGAMQSST